MRTMIKYALAFLCLSILSCGSKESKYVEIKEPRNTKKIIETRYYEAAGEIDGDFIPGEEWGGLLSIPTKIFYGADNEILLSIEDYGYSDYEQKYSLSIINYNYDSNHQLNNITEVSVQRNDVGWTGIVELIDTMANLTFKRNELGLVTEIEGFGTVITPDDEMYEATKFLYNKDRKVVKEIHDSHDYKTYQYFSLLNGHTVVKCDEYGKQYTRNFPAYQGKIRSSTEIYDSGKKKVKSLVQTYNYGKLSSDNETIFMYDDKNRIIKSIEKRAEAADMWTYYPDDTYEDFMNQLFELKAQYNTVKEYKYDKKGNLIYFKEGKLMPKLDHGFLHIGDKCYIYKSNPRNNEALKVFDKELKYYYNEYGDWYKCHRYSLILGNGIAIQNIEYKR